MLSEKQIFDAIGAERSKSCRSGSDCWDIAISFFNPDQPLQSGRWIHRFTIDVSEVIPITVGETRSRGRSDNHESEPLPKSWANSLDSVLEGLRMA